MSEKTVLGWQFSDPNGTFVLRDPHKHNYLYFPLVNEKGLISAVTPMLHGDIKTSLDTFLNIPVSVEDLHISRAARNFWIYNEKFGPWSVSGNAAPQIAGRYASGGAETVQMEAGFLWHKLTRENKELGLRAETTNFVPEGDDQVELMRVTLTNTGSRPLPLTPTAAIPIFGRSAGNLRDHRHVTSLLHRIQTHAHGVLVRPTLSFDERGHLPNTVTYAVLGADGEGRPPEEIIPVAEDFIGEGGTFDWPEAVVAPRDPAKKSDKPIDGFEAIGGLRFSATTIAPGKSQTYILILAVLEETAASPEDLIERYGNAQRFDAALEATQARWSRKLDTLRITSGDSRFDLWFKWVTLQPILRRLCGNSFLPYHDYGRGGRGWRDLWQDILALLIMNPGDVGELLFANFAGIRADGSNATIIKAKAGEFLADRNNIARTWMDHGAWPLLTTRLYLDQTGDPAFLLRSQTYFKDQLVHRAQKVDEDWHPGQGTLQRMVSGEPYHGTVLEHLLLQHLTPFFNVGEHNIIRLEGADWNDGMDMAPTRGESAAFASLYAGNLRQLCEIAHWMEKSGISQATVAKEMLLLLDTLADPVDYASFPAKRKRLDEYFDKCRHTFSGEKAVISLADLVKDLTRKADWLFEHIRRQEWLVDKEGFGWYNGYYDDDGQRVEGDHPNGVRMILTSQVFPLLSGIATDQQAREILRSANRYLLDPQMGGYRLNTDFKETLLNLGRCFGYAFGHKENGAMFSHIAVMFAYTLYQRGLVLEGFKVLDDLYRHCQNFSVSRMYPGLPEYINSRGRGMYPYLTGSASWYLLTLVTEVFGVRGAWGDLSLSPKLVRAQFDAKGHAQIQTVFAGRTITVRYLNPDRLDFDAYKIQTLQLNGSPVTFRRETGRVVIPREMITQLPDKMPHQITVTLGKKEK